MLKTEFLPESTRLLFKDISGLSELNEMALIGGTAIALHTGHRISEDLDFTVFEEKLPTWQIDRFIQKSQKAGKQVILATPHSQISNFKINTGKNLLDYARDYVIDGVKVTFFASGINKQSKFLSGFVENNKETTFGIMNLDGLFYSKALLLEKRQKSRDLFDLMFLIEKEDFSIETLFYTIEEYSESGLLDISKSVLTGENPIDPIKDEGLISVKVQDVTIDEIYQYFKNKVSEFEISEMEKVTLDVFIP